MGKARGKGKQAAPSEDAPRRSTHSQAAKAAETELQQVSSALDLHSNISRLPDHLQLHQTEGAGTAINKL